MVHQRDARVCQRTLCKTPCQYKVYDLRSYIQDVMHVILDDSAQIGATLTRGTRTGCGPLLTLLMGSTSSPDPWTAPFESGMLKLVLQSAILSRGTLAG